MRPVSSRGSIGLWIAPLVLIAGVVCLGLNSAAALTLDTVLDSSAITNSSSEECRGAWVEATHPAGLLDVDVQLGSTDGADLTFYVYEQEVASTSGGTLDTFQRIDTATASKTGTVAS
ncbi:MAG TPA: hypothetical protein DIU15_14205, partial [Deltaproteobacteria bacterium]|nr:hypothetical protein [Deltaproteobacteria bacterium]